MKYIFYTLIFITNIFARDVIDTKGECTINWTQGYIKCLGESAQGQRSYAAKLTAKIIAQRNILEVVQGVRITSDITVKDGIKSSDIIKSRMSGVIKGAQIISNIYDSTKGSSTATAKLRLGADVLSALLSDPKLLSFNEQLIKFWSNISFVTKVNASEYYEKDKKTIKKLLKDLRHNTQAKVFLEKILKNMDENTFSGILIDISNLGDFKRHLL